MMKKGAKWWKTLSVVAAAAALVAGCGSSGTSAGTQGGTVNLKLGMWSSSPAEKQLVDQQVAAFEKQNPNVHVEVQVITGDYLQALQPMLASHTAPDVFYVDSSYAATLEASGVLKPLDNEIQAQKVDINDFNPALLKAFQWKGQTFGLPKDFTTMALEYNPELLAKAGIQSPPKTWEEFVQDADKLRAKGITPLCMPIDVARYYPFVVDFWGSYYNDSTNKATFTDQANEPGLKFFLDNLTRKNIVTPKDLGADWAGPPFAQGKVAMVLEGAWLIPFMHQTAPNMKYGVVDFPPLNGQQKNMVFTVAYAESASTPHPNEATKLLFFMTGKEAERMTAESGLAIPARTSVQDVFLNKYPDYRSYINGAKHAIPYAFGTLGQNFTDAINKATEAGALQHLSPSAVLQQAAQTLASQTGQ